MAYSPKELFDAKFIKTLKELIATHHTLSTRIPPQGIFFESLVERSFLKAGWPRKDVVLENPNSPKADIKIKDTWLSLKTETGAVKREIRERYERTLKSNGAGKYGSNGNQ